MPFGAWLGLVRALRWGLQRRRDLCLRLPQTAWLYTTSPVPLETRKDLRRDVPSRLSRPGRLQEPDHPGPKTGPVTDGGCCADVLWSMCRPRHKAMGEWAAVQRSSLDRGPGEVGGGGAGGGRISSGGMASPCVFCTAESLRCLPAVHQRGGAVAIGTDVSVFLEICPHSRRHLCWGHGEAALSIGRGT